ncbi:MAG: DUF6343 family protein [Jiangellaceae bacterium]
MDQHSRDADRERFERGLDDYHDPTGGIGGATPARSALTLRFLLASFGLVLFGVATIISASSDEATLAAVFGAMTAVAAGNLAWVAYRKLRGEPG